MHVGRYRSPKSEKATCCLLALLLMTIPSLAPAEVLDAAENGFTVRHSEVLPVDRITAYEAVVEDVYLWWSDDHTVSADASNLYIEPRVNGCFCESLGDGDAALVHMSVSFVNPGVMLRLTGGLGPLGLMGVAGNMTLEFSDVEEGSTVTLQYAVGGYMPGGLDAVAPAVDAVLVEQLQSLRALLESRADGDS